MYHAARSECYPGISAQDFFNFSESCGILGMTLIEESVLQKCISETVGVTINNFKKSGDESIYRYEFLEILVRLSAFILRYQDQMNNTQGHTISTVLSELLTTIVLPRSKFINRYKFRRSLIQDRNVSELLNKNE